MEKQIRLECSDCARTFMVSEEYMEHVAKHLDTMAITCPFCNSADILNYR